MHAPLIVLTFSNRCLFIKVVIAKRSQFCLDSASARIRLILYSSAVMAFLEGPSLKQAEVIKQDIGEGPGDLERGVRDLRSMLAASPYLPEPDSVGRQ